MTTIGLIDQGDQSQDSGTRCQEEEEGLQKDNHAMAKQLVLGGEAQRERQTLELEPF